MKKTLFILLSFIVLISCSKTEKKNRELISNSSTENENREQNINSIFDKMESQGIDTKAPLLYGFYFYDIDKSKLEKLSCELLKDNYKLVRLERTEKQEFILHVEKTEIHSRITLLEREKQLEKLAIKFQISKYDGWDVGNVDSSKPLISDEDFEKTLRNKTKVELFNLANKLYCSEVYNKAIIVFQKCIEISYKTDTSYYKQGVSYLSIGETEISLAKFEKAIEANPKYSNAYFNIAAISYDKHDYEKTIKYYTNAAKLDPKNDKIYYGIAAAQYVQGLFKEAERNCQTALKINPANIEAKNLLASMNLKH